MARVLMGVYLAAIIALFCLLSMSGVGNYHLSSDEMQHVDVAKASGLSQMTRDALHETHPPFSYLPLHYWMMISENPDWMRGLALVFSVSLILLFYHMGRQMGGSVTGLYAAGLLAFGQGFLIQSYVVRSYTLFVLCLSLALYFYLKWRKDKKPGQLAGYGCFALLACLTHFSGMFWLLCVGGYQAFSARKTGFKRQFPWLAVNGAIALAAFTTYHIWSASSSMRIDSFFVHHPLSVRLIAGLLYPLLACSYFLPSYELALILVPLWIILRPKKEPLADDEPFRVMVTLLTLAFILATLLTLFGLYVIIDQLRRAMWMLPFVIFVVARMLADMTQLTPARWARPIALLVILATGWLAYNPGVRFSARNPDEYMLPVADWRALTNFLKKLGPHDAIVTSKYDLFELGTDKNPYRYIGTPLLVEPMEAVMPYYQTHIFFSRSYIYYQPERFMVLEPVKNALDDIDTLVFVKLVHSDGHVMNLFLCKELPKKIIAFPPLPGGQEMTMKDLKERSALLLTVSKKDFFEQAIAPTGKAHHCL